MLRLFCISLFLILGYNSYSQVDEIENSNRLFIYGSENYYFSKSQEFIAKKWNLEVYRVAGISIEKKLLDSVKVENKNLWKNLDQTLNIDSKKKFFEEVKYEFKRVNEAVEILDSNRKVKRIIRKIEDRKTNSYITLETKKNDHIYIYIYLL